MVAKGLQTNKQVPWKDTGERRFKVRGLGLPARGEVAPTQAEVAENVLRVRSGRGPGASMESQPESEGGRQGRGGARGEWEGGWNTDKDVWPLETGTQMRGQLEVETEALGVFVLGRGRPEYLSELESVEKEGELKGSGQERVREGRQ